MVYRSDILEIGQHAERRVLAALACLEAPWQVFPTVEWRTLRDGGEAIGEADVAVFHPQYGLVVIEIKAGSVEIRDGIWYYASGHAMKQSPFSQARRNRYALADKLIHRLGSAAVGALTMTHAVWFPDVYWSAPLPGAEAPSRDFLLDRATLANPEKALLRLFKAASAAPVVWPRPYQKVLKEILAPDCHLLVPLAGYLDDALSELQRATEQQVAVLRLLRHQSRLLVEGCAGSGKTQLAVMLAREHAALGKSVLLTCFNRNLAEFLADIVSDTPAVTVMNFHELVRTRALAASLPFDVPDDMADRVAFFQDECPQLLADAAVLTGDGFDTLIVDEGADFAPTWWIALESLGNTGFSWYCFYDRQQTLYRTTSEWSPPFGGAPFVLDFNLRNTRPIGEQAARWGRVAFPQTFRVESGASPEIIYSQDYVHMGEQLRQLLKRLTREERIAPERIAVLSPYRHTNRQSTWSAGLSGVEISTHMREAVAGKVRVGTIHGFKGLETDVAILAGLDLQAAAHPEWLYVGASRARVALYALFLECAGNSDTF